MEKLLELYRNYLTDEIKKEMYVNWADKECIDMFEAEEVEEERLYKFLNQLSVLKKFIKWLVDNNKIDLSKLEKIWYKKIVYEDYWQYKTIVEYSDYESLLMLLSISNSPIEDLISYLR